MRGILFTIISLLIFSGIFLIANISIDENFVFGQYVKYDDIKGESTDAPTIPDWVDQNFRWYGEGLIEQSELVNAIKYLIDNEIMVLDPERANTINQLKEENEKLRMENAELLSDVFNRSDEPLQHTDTADVTLSDSGDNQMSPLGPGNIFVNPGAVIRQAITPLTFSSQVIGDLMDSGVATEDDWEDAIASFSVHGLRESVIPELQGIVVLCNNEIDKKIQSIDVELKILEMWLEIISNEQESSSYDASDRLTSDTTESTVQYRESDLNFISRTLSSIDQQIKALDTGIMVLEEKLSSVGDDSQEANIDLQSVLQKQQQTLQTMSNVSKMLHDTQMSIIRNMR